MRIFFTVIMLGCMSILFFAGCQNEAAEYIESVHKIPVANAGPSVTITSPATTATLNGSGTSANGPIIGYLWSMVSGPNSALIQTPGSKNTVISNLIAGNYVFQLMVVDSAGYTGVDTASVHVLPAIAPVQQTITLQPSNNQKEIHFFGSATLNLSGHATELDAEAWTLNGNPIAARGAFSFDIASSVPASATIVSAKLTLYSNPTPNSGDLINANSGSSNAMYIRRISSAWTAAGATWANQPATTTVNQVSVPHTNQPFLDLTDIDVKNLVADMRTSGDNGFMISLQNEVIYNSRIFCSSIYTDASKHPKLVIVYQ